MRLFPHRIAEYLWLFALFVLVPIGLMVELIRWLLR